MFGSKVGSKVGSVARESPRDSDISGFIFNDSKSKASLSISQYRPLTSRSDIASPAIYQGTEEDDILNTEWERILYEVEDDGGVLKGKQLEKDSVISKKDIVMNARK